MEKNFQTEVLERLVKIETKLDGYAEFKKIVYEADNRSKENQKDIEEVKEKLKWLSRTITGAIITGIIGIVFIFVKIGMGV